MQRAADEEQFELAAKYRDMISTVHELRDKQRMAAAGGDDADVFGFHFANQMLAVNLFHMRSGRVLDRREFFWDELPHADLAGDAYPGAIFSSLLKQLYIGQQYVPPAIYVPVDFNDRRTLEEVLTAERGAVVHIIAPLRGEKRALVDFAARNAKHSYDQRFRVLRPSARRIAAALQDALTLPEAPRRIECFDISHLQGAETVASMVVWEEGEMKKNEYRKFIIREQQGVDDFAAMREVVSRRYKRLKKEGKPLPGIALVDGGIGQLHAAADALQSLAITNLPLASIAKREEIIYVYGQEDEPVVLDRFSPVLHLVQQVRDEAHRFAVTFHRTRRNASRMTSELHDVPGVGLKTVEKLLRHFGSLERVRQATEAELMKVAGRAATRKLKDHFAAHQAG
jgi:excinuclease ABC subunit C